MTMLPPAYYDHPPEIPVIEHVLAVEEVTKVCAERLGPPPLGSWWGCATRLYQGSKLVCVVYRIDDGTVRRHELGHCNGWPGNHQDKPPEFWAPVVVKVPLPRPRIQEAPKALPVRPVASPRNLLSPAPAPWPK
jgi:hypothetical protein